MEAIPNSPWPHPNFRYFGESVTDANGMYSFKMIKLGRSIGFPYNKGHTEYLAVRLKR